MKNSKHTSTVLDFNTSPNRETANPAEICYIERLPHEVLLHFFVLLYKSGYFTLGFSSVCQKWRIVIISNARFWTSIPIYPKNGTFLDINESTERLKMLISRSGQRELDISWSFPAGVPPASIKSLSGTLIAQAPTHRWRKLHVENCLPSHEALTNSNFEALRELSLASCSSALFAAMERTTKQLSTLTIYRTNIQALIREYPRIFASISTLGVSMSSLRDASLPTNIKRVICNNKIERWMWEGVQLPYVIHITASKGIDTQQLDGSKLPSLARLEVGKEYGGDNTNEVTLLNLRHLILSDISQNGIRSIDAPNIEVLEFRGHSTYSTWDFLGGVFQATKLSTLKIFSKVDQANLKHILSEAKHLEHLTVAVHSAPNMVAIILALRLPSGPNVMKKGPLICPALATLEAIFPGVVHTLTGRAWANRVFNTRGSGPLRTITVTWSDGNKVAVSSDDALKGIENLIKLNRNLG